MRKTLLFASLVVACGGAVVGPIGDGGGTDGTAGGDGGGGGGSDGSTGNDCDSLLAQINSQQAQLQTCCPTCKSLQCQGTAKGICCPITINGTEKGSFEALVTKYTQLCPHACPNIPCPPAPSMMCIPSQMVPNSGRCQ